MHGKPVYLALALAASAPFLCSAGPPRAAGALTVVKRANGPEIVLDRRAGSDVVCVMVAVNAGSSCETPDTRGATHFIEHMAFDGSERYTREEISGWVDDVGGFLNAFTRKETTVFFLLVPSVHFEKGVEILSQMLLHSVLLPEEFEKERKVILEEIRRERDDPRTALEGIVDRYLYRGSLLTEPIIGYPATIEAMSDSALKAFYGTYYRPSNMRIVITGSFDPNAAEQLVDEYFPPGPGAAACGSTSAPTWSNEISADSIAAGESGFDILVPFPSGGESDFPAALLVARMIEGEGSPLAESLEALSLPAPETSLEIYRGFAALRIHVGAAESGGSVEAGGSARAGGSAGDGGAAYRKIPAALESLADWTPSGEELDKARVSYLSGEMFDREMYHFYIMSRGDAIALHGALYLSQSDAVALVSAKDCAKVIEKAFRPLRFNACLIEKKAGSGEPAGKPGPPGMPGTMPRATGMPPGMGSRMPSTSAIPPGMSAHMPPAPAMPPRESGPARGAAVPAKDVGISMSTSTGSILAVGALPNGCTVAAIAREGSPVAALHILLKGRACSEGEAPAGLPEILMTLLESSAAGKVLAARLDALGARIQFGDNPYVPQDDYLLSPAFAFVRLEAPAGSIEEAASLVVRQCHSSAVTEADRDEAKRSLAREVGMRSASATYTIRSTMWSSLLGEHPFAAPLFPAPTVIMRTTLDEIQSLRGRLFAGGNIIATLVSPLGPSTGCKTLGKLFGSVPAGPGIECPPLPDSAEAASLEKGTRKETAYVAAGWLARSAKPIDRASFLIAGEVLSRRMQLELREKRGLAYSIECGVTPLPGGAVILAYLGTGASRLEEARAALEQEVRGLGERPPDAAEVEVAKSRLLGRRARSELSSINEAYVLGFDLLLCGRLSLLPMNALIPAATVEDVKGAAESVLAWDRATVLRLVPEAPEGK
jgi:predicted Zn-dependent peptidase